MATGDLRSQAPGSGRLVSCFFTLWEALLKGSSGEDKKLELTNEECPRGLTGFMGRQSTVARALASARGAMIDRMRSSQTRRKLRQEIMKRMVPAFRRSMRVRGDSKTMAGVIASAAALDASWKSPDGIEAVCQRLLDAPLISVGTGADQRRWPARAPNKQAARGAPGAARSYATADLHVAATANKTADGIASEIIKALSERPVGTVE